MTNPQAVQLIYTILGWVFLLALLAGFSRTAARVLYYARHKGTRPRLLTRDVIVYGGFSITFGLITLVRLLPQDDRVALTTGNVLWALSTTVPACIAVLTYLYFELFIIERGWPR